MIRLMPLFLSLFVAGSVAVATQDSLQSSLDMGTQAQEAPVSTIVSVDADVQGFTSIDTDGFIGIMH